MAALLLQTDFSYAPNPVHARPAAPSLGGHGQEEADDNVVAQVEDEDDSGAASDDCKEEDICEVSAGAGLRQEVPHR